MSSYIKLPVMQAIRRAVKPFLVDSGDISRPTQATDDAGTTVDTFSTVATALPCMVEFLERVPIENVTGQKVTVFVDAHISFEAGTDVRRQDRITITFNRFSTPPTQVFEVVRMLAPETYEGLRTVYCKVVE